MAARERGAPRNAAEADRLFRALGEPRRRALLERLSREGELTVRELAAQAGVSQPLVSQHLAVLHAAGLVARRRSGRYVICQAAPNALAQLVDWMSYFTVFWRARVEALSALLERTADGPGCPVVRP